MVQGDLLQELESESVVIQPTQGGLFDKAVLISISISCLGTKRKVKASAVVDDEMDIDKGFLHISKDILQSPILTDIKKFDSITRKWIADRSLPSMFRSGIYLWPIALVLEADSYLQARGLERAQLVDKFMAVYAAVRAEAAQKLGDLYNPADYPPADEVLNQFSQSYQFIECGVPGRLKDINQAMFEREQQKAEKNWTEALTEAKTILRTQLAELVNHMADRLGVDEEGKPKKFKNTLVSNLDNFLKLFQCKNFADDSELAAVVDECKAIMAGTTAEKIRDDKALRACLSAGFDAIKAKMESLVTTAGRAIDLTESDAGDEWGDI